MLVSALAQALAELGLEGRRLLVAVSGGIDSTVLLDGLHALAEPCRLELAVAHVHHGLRGNEADADEQAVRDQARRRGLDCLVERVDPHALRQGCSNRERPTLQEAARTLRYAALLRMAERAGADHVATAHNLDDQAETVLMRLFRGAGPDALGGIAERSADGRIVRPLLAVSREQIVRHARARGLHWREDSSNESDDYTRNRLRRHWLPELSRAFNPQLLRAIANLAEAQRRDSEWIEAIVGEAAEQWLRASGDEIEIVAEAWSGLPDALARRLARRAVIALGGGRDLSRVHLERMLAFIAGGVEAGAADRCATLELPGGLRLTRELGRYRLQRAQ